MKIIIAGQAHAAPLILHHVCRSRMPAASSFFSSARPLAFAYAPVPAGQPALPWSLSPPAADMATHLQLLFYCSLLCTEATGKGISPLDPVALIQPQCNTTSH